MIKKLVCTLGLAVLVFTPAASTLAQPASGTIRLIVATAPGGGLDALGRLVATEAGRIMGTAIYVDNKTSSNSILPLLEAARSAPDGRNFLLTTMGPLVNNVALVAKLPYDPVKDFVPVVRLARLPMAVFVRADSPYKTLQDLVNAARAHPRALNFANIGPANLVALAAERLGDSQKFQFTPVPYNSESAMMLAIMSGQVDATITTVAGGIGLVKGGKLRMLGILDTARFPSLPDVPTLIELGMPDLEAAGLPVIVAPAGTPKEAIDRFNKAVNQLLRQPDVQQKLRDMAMISEGGTPEDVTAMMKVEGERWLPVIKRLGIRPE